MHVFRGRAETIAADRRVSDRLLEVAAGDESAVRVWVPHRQIAFGRRDARLDGYECAREAAQIRGFPPVERSVGGRAVAYDGETTIAFARAEPIADFRRGTDERYERLTAAVEGALEELGIDLERGEPADAFCPGTHSLSTVHTTGRRKLVGIAQRVRSEAALVSGILIADARAELAAVLEAVYDELEVPFNPGTLGSIAAAGGPSDPEQLQRVLETALVGDGHESGPLTVEDISESIDGAEL